MNSIISSVNPSDTVRIVGSYAVFTTTEIENLNNSAVASYYSEPVYLPSSESGKTARTKVSSKAQQELVRIYPNPASDVLNVVTDGVVKGKVALFDLTGKLLLQQELNYGTAILNVKRLTQGMYLVRIYAEDNEEVQTVKVVVAGKYKVENRAGTSPVFF